VSEVRVCGRVVRWKIIVESHSHLKKVEGSVEDQSDELYLPTHQKGRNGRRVKLEF
jgi:hypothetical protein